MKKIVLTRSRLNFDSLRERMEAVRREEQKSCVGGGNDAFGYLMGASNDASYGTENYFVNGTLVNEENPCQCIFDSMIANAGEKFRPSDCTGTTGHGTYSGYVKFMDRDIYVVFDIGLSGNGHPYYYTECASKASAPYGKKRNGEPATKHTFQNTTATGHAFEMWMIVPDSAQDIIDKYLCN